MSKTFRPFEPDQMFLLPPSLTEWLPKNHLVFFIREVLDEMEGPMALNRCLIEPLFCSRTKSCVVHGVWCEAQDMLRNLLASRSFAELAARNAATPNPQVPAGEQEEHTDPGPSSEFPAAEGS